MSNLILNEEQKKSLEILKNRILKLRKIETLESEKAYYIGLLYSPFILSKGETVASREQQIKQGIEIIAERISFLKEGK